MHSSKTPRIQSIQLLRILAALAVAVTHQLYAFADKVGGGLSLPASDGQLAQAAVCAFFFVSGYVMVVSSERLFGTLGGVRVFMTRRIVRVVPSYWIATAALLLVLALVGTSVAPADILRSLLFVPYWREGGESFPVPLLWPGWSLFYEMVFYVIFGSAIVLGRWRAALVTTLVLALLVMAGTLFDPQAAFFWMITRPVMLVFPCGVALALWRAGGATLPVTVRAGFLLAAVFAYLLAPLPAGGSDLGFAYLLWAALPAICLCIALVGGPLQVPAFGLVDRLGDASYALYLLHIPMAWLWIWAAGRMSYQEPVTFALSLGIGTVLVSWLFYTMVERPSMERLNRRLGASTRQDSKLERSGV